MEAVLLIAPRWKSYSWSTSKGTMCSCLKWELHNQLYKRVVQSFSSGGALCGRKVMLFLGKQHSGLSWEERSIWKSNLEKCRIDMNPWNRYTPASISVWFYLNSKVWIGLSTRSGSPLSSEEFLLPHALTLNKMKGNGICLTDHLAEIRSHQ